MTKKMFQVIEEASDPDYIIRIFTASSVQSLISVLKEEYGEWDENPMTFTQEGNDLVENEYDIRIRELIFTPVKGHEDVAEA